MSGPEHARRVVSTALLLVVLLSVVGGPVGTVAAGNVSGCTTISDPGTYTLAGNVPNDTTSTCITITASDVVFDGNGHTIDGVDSDGGSVGIEVSGTSVTNVTVRNVSVTNWDTGVSVTDLDGGRLVAVDASGNAGTGISVSGATDVVVRDNVVNNTGSNGIYLHGGTTDTTVEGNTLNDTGASPIYLSGVTHNDVVDNTITYSAFFGIYLFDADDNEVRGNNATANEWGLYVQRSARNEIRNNRFAASEYNGADVTGDGSSADGNVLVNNTFVRNGQHGLWVRDAANDTVVRNNAFRSNANRGLYLRSVGNATITDSSFSENTRSIYVESSSGVTIENATASNPSQAAIGLDGSGDVTVRNSEATGADEGLLLLDTDDSRFVGNTLSGNGVAGIAAFRLSTGNVFADNTLSDNRIGIDLGSSSDNVVRANVIENNPGTGARLFNSGNVTVARNTVVGNGEGIRVSGSTDARVLDNTVRDQSEPGISLVDSSGSAVRRNEIRNNGVGIHVDNGANSNVVANNTVAGSAIGIDLYESDSNTVANNTVTGNDRGVRLLGELGDTTDNDVNDNRITDSRVGIYVVGATGNAFANNAVRNSSDWHYVAEPNTGYYGVRGSENAVENLTIGNSTAPNASVSFRGANVSLDAVTSPPPLPDGTREVGRFVEATNTTWRNAYLNLTVPYDEAAVEAANVGEATLSLWKYNSSAGWVEVGGTVDTAANTVSGNVTSFSTVAVLGRTPPNVSVTVDSTNSPVIEGGTLDVTVTATNTGGQTGMPTIELAVGGSVRDSTTVTLAGGASTTVTLSWDTSSGDAGSYGATVDSGTDSDATSVSVLAPANFVASIDSTDSPVVAGDALDVTATVTNRGDVSDTQVMALSIDGSIESTQSVTLTGGESRTITLSWPTGDDDVGDYTATVASNDPDSTAGDSTSVQVVDELAATFDVTLDGTNSPVDAGDALNVTATVRNAGTVEGTQTVSLSVDDTERDDRSVTLAAGETRTVDLSWTTGAGDAGNYTATVATANDSASANVTVETGARPNFGVTVAGTNSPVDEGAVLNVTASVANVGNATGTRRVSLSVDGTERDGRNVTLASGERENVTLSWTTGTGDAGNYTATVATANDSASANVTVAAADGEEERSAVVGRYANPETGRVTTDGLSNALRDWSRQGITTEELLAVIAAWSDGEGT